MREDLDCFRQVAGERISLQPYSSKVQDLSSSGDQNTSPGTQEKAFSFQFVVFIYQSPVVQCVCVGNAHLPRQQRVCHLAGSFS